MTARRTSVMDIGKKVESSKADKLFEEGP